MLPTYPAILRDGQLEWGEAGPPPVSPNVSLSVHVTILDPERLKRTGGEAMALALEAFANAGGPTFTTDPVEWQREVRQDRLIPGRCE